jgi:hypothetical protein
MFTVASLTAAIPHTVNAQYFVLRDGKLTKDEQSARSRTPPLEWQYWIFPNGASGRSRQQARGVISAGTRDSLEMELQTVLTLREELQGMSLDSARRESPAYDALMGPIAVYDDRNDYGGLIKQGIRALSKFAQQRAAIRDSLRTRVSDSTSQVLFAAHTRSLLIAYDAHHTAQERIDRGIVLRDMSVVRQLDSTLNILSRQQNELRAQIGRMRPMVRVP